MPGNYTGSIMFALFSSLIVILLAFIVTKFIATKYSNLNAGNNNMRVVERLNMGLDRYLAIVAVKETYYLVSITKKGIELIDKLDTLVIDEKRHEKKSLDFKDILKDFRNKK